jgi:lipopolysaccharide export system permease protein
VSVSNPAVVLQSNSVTRTNDITAVVGDVDKQKVSDLLFFDQDPNHNQRIVISRNATVSTPSDKSVLMQIDMKDATIASLNPRKRGDYDVITSKDVKMNLFASTIFQPDSSRNPNEYPFRDLKKQVDQMEANPNVSKTRINFYVGELNKKFSLPFGSLVFAFLALPLAIIFGKHNGQTIGLIVGLFLSFAYWAMIIVGQRLAYRNGWNSVPVIWFPDAIIFVFASIFFVAMRKR